MQYVKSSPESSDVSVDSVDVKKRACIVRVQRRSESESSLGQLNGTIKLGRCGTPKSQNIQQIPLR